MIADLRISGEAYFALTPQVAMGGTCCGGRLAVRVLFSAYADFLVHFHPFHFEGEVSIALFASAALDLWLWVQHFGPLGFGASLKLRGTPKPQPLNLGEFIRMVKNLPLDKAPGEKEEREHMVSFIAGRANRDHTGEGDCAGGEVEVLAEGVVVEVQARVPILNAKISGVPKDGTKKKIFAQPMQLLSGGFDTSELVISLRRREEDERKEEEIIVLEAKPLVKNLPPALWGECVEKPDPREAMIPHVMGYTLTVPSKLPSRENIPAVDVTRFNSVDVGLSGLGKGEGDRDYYDIIPPLKPVQRLDDDDKRFIRPSAEVKPKDDDELKKRRKKRKDAFAAWDLFKGTCSGGGLLSAGTGRVW
ncbi:hypothetical protein QBC46DRAFT_349139 [Diplogelasinospora grovesii]|uniref:DUF6603 domain-containing protein n=1 Tax=Diplogelasinospora grovesii TaxID=303347 RepID=A0AAN6SAH8_9PEZI|nr:hypothetical protein QBC46DRAFT_349139 [Diplogelasinospora grovesii]